jgi:epoxyqueuosine reductase
MKSSSVLKKELLQELEVLDWGYTEDPIPHSLKHYEDWTSFAHHGSLAYLNDQRRNLRQDLRHVFPEFKSALVFLFSYRSTKKWMLERNRHEVASYSLGFGGEDYHYVVKNKLQKIAASLGGIKTFISLDTQPILERDLAYRAGLGWFGKNSMLINRYEGSYFIIGSLLLDHTLDVESNRPDIDHCGSCTACADACPTKAIDASSRTLIADKCISTFTIEMMKEVPPPTGFEKSRGEIFGCDICQDVCPWNSKPLARTIASLNIQESLSFLIEWFYEWPVEKLLEIISQETNRGLRKKLSRTSFDRPRKKGWLKNLRSIRSDLLGTHRGEE